MGAAVRLRPFALFMAVTAANQLLAADIRQHLSPEGAARAAAGTQDYTIRFQAGTLSARSFTLEAVPRTGGSMASDKCGTLRINNVGRRTVSGESGGMTAATCWR